MDGNLAMQNEMQYESEADFNEANNIKANKLTLEHLAPYLPYGLKMFTPVWVRNITELTTFNFDLVTSFFNTKAILRPMSDLCKEIDLNGETFIPLAYLYNISNGNPHHNELKFEFIDSWGAGKILKVLHYNNLDYTEFIYADLSFRKDTHYEKGFYRFGMNLPHSIKVASELNNQYHLQNLLFKWHFDVFGLIEKGLAISIHDVKTTTNA